MKFLGWILIAIYFNGVQSLTDEEEQDLNVGLSDNYTYCYEFTWFGPKYTKTLNYSGTCEDYLDETRAVGVPCSPPIVISNDGSPPDMDYLWNNHRASILCQKAEGDVCASYTYYYDGQISNATHMCTKVQAIGEGPVSSGCYTQKVDEYEVKLCVCESRPGIYRPCNSQQTLIVYLNLILFIQILLICFK